MEQLGPAGCHLMQMTPPIDVIMRGCEKYEDVQFPKKYASKYSDDDDIPF